MSILARAHYARKRGANYHKFNVNYHKFNVVFRFKYHKFNVVTHKSLRPETLLKLLISLRRFRAETKRFQFLKILIIKPFKSIIKCKKRTKQNSDYQKTSFVRFLYLRSDFCPSLIILRNISKIHLFR